MKKFPPMALAGLSAWCVDGWFELNRRFGRIDMEKILKPAIEYAREGFPVTEADRLLLGRNANKPDVVSQCGRSIHARWSCP